MNLFILLFHIVFSSTTQISHEDKDFLSLPVKERKILKKFMFLHFLESKRNYSNILQNLKTSENRVRETRDDFKITDHEVKCLINFHKFVIQFFTILNDTPIIFSFRSKLLRNESYFTEKMRILDQDKDFIDEFTKNVFNKIFIIKKIKKKSNKIINELSLLLRTEEVTERDKMNKGKIENIYENALKLVKAIEHIKFYSFNYIFTCTYDEHLDNDLVDLINENIIQLKKEVKFFELIHENFVSRIRKIQEMVLKAKDKMIKSNTIDYYDLQLSIYIECKIVKDYLINLKDSDSIISMFYYKDNQQELVKLNSFLEEHKHFHEDLISVKDQISYFQSVYNLTNKIVLDLQKKLKEYISLVNIIAGKTANELKNYNSETFYSEIILNHREVFKLILEIIFNHDVYLELWFSDEKIFSIYYDDSYLMNSKGPKFNEAEKTREKYVKKMEYLTSNFSKLKKCLNNLNFPHVEEIYKGLFLFNFDILLIIINSSTYRDNMYAEFTEYYKNKFSRKENKA